MNKDTQPTHPNLGEMQPTPRRKSWWALVGMALFRLWQALLVLMVMIGGMAVAVAGRQVFFSPPVATPPMSSAAPTAAAATPSPLPLAATPAPEAPPQATPARLAFPQGLLVLAIREGVYSHLFAYNPDHLPLTRLTADADDQIAPAISPDGTTVAYAAHTPQGWDLFLLSLQTGERTRLTADAAYDGAPSWSPDGLWMAYEHYNGTNLDIYIRDRAGQQQPIALTAHPAADYAPAWGPQGRWIAFVSTRDGVPQVFLANLDKTGADRFRRVSRPEDGPARHPAWSPDGRYLAWSQTTEGVPLIYVWDVTQPASAARAVGEGWWPQWLPDQEGGKHVVAAVVRLPNGAALAAYDLAGGLVLPLKPLPGTVEGFSARASALPWPLPGALAQAAAVTPTLVWTPRVSPDGLAGRLTLRSLPGVEAPYPQLSDAADEAFAALRAALAARAGWDVLGTLDNAYVPLTAPLPPKLGKDWLYTGRAIALTTRPLSDGWMAVVREDLAPYTYWRVFVRAAEQDGTQGQPLRALPWDFNARFGADITAFESGGAYAVAVPPGYWVDVTAAAQALGWERLPALPNWRAYVPGARFNEFVLRQGLTWDEAMRQIYPGQVIALPTPHATPDIPVVPPTPTP